MVLNRRGVRQHVDGWGKLGGHIRLGEHGIRTPNDADADAVFAEADTTDVYHVRALIISCSGL